MTPPWTPPVRTLRDVLVDAERRLANAGVPTPRVDAELLLAHVLEVPRGRMFLSDPVDAGDAVRFESLLIKRAARQPLQHLLGEAAFRHLVLEVGRGVFVPRPETEGVAELAIRALRDLDPPRVAVDLCAGSGAIALSLATEVPGTEVHAVELDPPAAVWTRRNAERHASAVTEARSALTVHEADATTVHLGALAPLVGRVDVVVTNPPYIPDEATPRDPEVAIHDPRRALYGGPDGLDVLRVLADAAAALLRPGGVLVVEHSDQQGESGGEHGVPGVLRAHGAFTTVEDHPDLAGRDRCTTALRA